VACLWLSWENRRCCSLRAAEAADVPVMFQLIGELADYERLRHQMVGDAERSRGATCSASRATPMR
jgi:hypothetical protein